MILTADVIAMLRNHRQISAKITIIQNTLLYQKDSSTVTICMLLGQQEDLIVKRDIVDAWLQLLPIEERFLVQTHLIDGLDWAKTIVEHEKMWGVMNGRSERTLKRIQAKAIDRIVACLSQIEGLSEFKINYC